MRSLNNLSLKEKFLIIAHHPSKGRFMVSEIILNHGIIGALLLELSNEELIYLKNKKLGVKSRKTKDELLASMLARINNSPKERSLKSWVSRLSNKSKKYKWGILNTLSDKAILKINKRKFLGLIPYKLTYFTNNKIREDLIENINNLVFKNKKLNNEDIALLSLIDACKMHKIFCKTSDERKKFKKNLKSVLDNNPITDAVAKSIKEVQAAVVGVVAGAAVASTVTSSN